MVTLKNYQTNVIYIIMTSSSIIALMKFQNILYDAYKQIYLQSVSLSVYIISCVTVSLFIASRKKVIWTAVYLACVWWRNIIEHIFRPKEAICIQLKIILHKNTEIPTWSYLIVSLCTFYKYFCDLHNVLFRTILKKYTRLHRQLNTIPY